MVSKRGVSSTAVIFNSNDWLSLKLPSLTFTSIVTIPFAFASGVNVSVDPFISTVTLLVS